MNKFFSFMMAVLGIHSTTACSQANYQDADVEAFAVMISQPDVQIVDTRTAGEFAENHLEGAVNIDVNEGTFLRKATEQLAKDRPVAVYCRSGKRSAKAAQMLSAEGFEVCNMLGGIMAWQGAGKAVTRDTHAMDVFKTKGGKAVRFFALMHASILVDYDGLKIYIDPVRQLGERTVDYNLLPKADLIFVTHEHQDHFDMEAIRQLSKEGTRLVTNRRCADMNGDGLAMANGETQDLQLFTVEAVPAYNTTEGHLQYHPKGRDNGYILDLDGLRVYIAGDTEDIPEMDAIGEKAIDIAFLPCNQPFTMTPDQLLNAARMVKPRVLFPYHYGQTDVSAIPDALKNEGISVRIRHYE